MNVLFLMAGEERSGEKDNNYPIVLTEIENKPLIEWQIESARILPNSEFIFAIRDESLKKYHLDNVINLLRPDSKFITINEKTKGSACTALMAVEHINTNEPLLILNSDEIIRTNYLEVIQEFEKRDLDAGAIVFNSVHPRYSFLKTDPKTSLVVEAAEKNPISRNATAGFYYFKHGSEFVKAAQAMIKKGASVDGNFYICPAFNELILNQAKIGVYQIDASQYIPLKSEANLNNLKNLFEAKA